MTVEFVNRGSHRLRLALLLAMALLLALSSFSVAAPTSASESSDANEYCDYFAETDTYLCYGFRSYWNDFGGEDVFGRPLTGEFQENGMTVQYFENARFEWHPGVWPERHDVLQGLLGAELTREMRAGPSFVPAEEQADCRYFALTSHNVCDEFLDLWGMSGGLPVIGYPISEAYDFNGIIIQYFERARFELRPGERPGGSNVVLGRVGGEVLAASAPPSDEPIEGPLVSGLEVSTGSTVGPDGALYVTEGAAGRVTRVDPVTGETSTLVSGLPQANPALPFGGPMDVAFIESTAYVLVSVVGPDVGGAEDEVVGIYQVDGPDEFTVIADIGAYLDPATVENPETIIDVPSGVQFQMAVYQGDLLVTDGHYNRVLQVSLDGEISELLRFGNDVPTGLAIEGDQVFIALAGAVPHLPEDGEIVVYDPASDTVTDVAAGSPLLVDVVVGPDGGLYALSQGVFEEGMPPGAPAQPDSGALVRVNEAGGFDTIADGLNLPTSLQFIDGTAYVVTHTGEVWVID